MNAFPAETNPSRSVLLVEDDPAVFGAIRRVLELEGFVIQVVTRVAEARDHMAKEPFNALITDIMMPGESGDVLLRETVQRCPGLPVVVITGYATTDLALEMLALGAFDFLPKPFSFEELSALAARLGRFLALPGEDRKTLLEGRLPFPAGKEKRLCLMGHAWTALNADGSAAAGIGTLPAATTGETVEAALPGPGEEVIMGQPCVVLRDRQGYEHGIRAPLTGRVLAAADREEVLGAERKAYLTGAKALFLLRPARFEIESAHLRPCPAAAGKDKD